VAEVERDGYLGNEADPWVRDVLDRLRSGITATKVSTREDTFDSIIEWDDGGWPNPAMEFVSLPLCVIDVALADYPSVMPLDGDDIAEQRILWDRLIAHSNGSDSHPSPEQHRCGRYQPDDPSISSLRPPTEKHPSSGTPTASA